MKRLKIPSLLFWEKNQKPAAMRGRLAGGAGWYSGKASVGGGRRVLAHPFDKLQHGDVHEVQCIIGNPHMPNTQKYPPGLLGKSGVIFEKYLTKRISIIFLTPKLHKKKTLDLNSNSQFPIVPSYAATHMHTQH